MGHVTLKSLLARKFRLVLTSIAVVLGVAFMAGTFVLTDTLGNVFDDLFTDTTKGVDVVVRSREPFKAENDQGGNAETRPPVPASLEQTVQRMPGVKLAQGSVFEYALVIGKDGKAVQNQAPTFGTSWHLPPRVNQSLDLKRGRQPRTPAQVALDLKTAEDAGYRIGDQVTVSFQSAAPRKFELTGIFEFGGKENGLAGATLAAFTPPTAQQVMNRVGQWDEIQVRGDPGLSEVGLRDRIRTELRKAGDAKKYEAITGEQLANEQSDDLKSNLSFFNTFLLIFALVALFVGAFIIYNTFSITVAQRTRELGLLRALGASGRQVVASVALEALAVGVLSAVLGLALGIAIVKPLEALLSAFGIDLPSGSLQILPRTIVVSFLVGALVTVVSSLAPARRAARVPPIAALRAHAVGPTSGPRRYVWGAIFGVLGLAALVQGLFGNSDQPELLVGVAAALVFIGVAMLSPLLARPAARVLTLPAEWTKSITGLLARENVMRNPRRTASTAAALMIGLALVTLIAIFGASAKSSFAEAIDNQTHADFVMSSETFQPFSADAANGVRRRLPGSTVVPFRNAAVEVDGNGEQVLGTTANFRRVTDAPIRNFDRAQFASNGVLVFKDVIGEKVCVGNTPCHVGSKVRMRFPKGEADLTISGVFTDRKALPFNGNYIITLQDWDKRFLDSLDSFVLIRKPSDVSTQQAHKVVQRVAHQFGGIKAQNKAEFKDDQLARFDQVLNLMYVLLLFAVIIALMGIVNTLALSIYERTQEIGLLRAVGMTRVQLRRMVRGEALVVAVFGSLLGLGIGLGFGGAIVQALKDEGISLSLPVGQLLIFLVLAGLAGLGAGWPPARRAAHLDVLRAINTE